MAWSIIILRSPLTPFCFYTKTMALPDIFSKTVSDTIVSRIEQLTPETQPVWGKMSVAQMLAHCNVTYEMALENIHAKPGFMGKMLLKTFVKNTVVSEKAYAKNSRTAPAFLISNERDFNAEKKRLITYINRTQELGSAYFEGRESHSFGQLSAEEWNNMFYKHLDHHLGQFGV